MKKAYDKIQQLYSRSYFLISLVICLVSARGHLLKERAEAALTSRGRWKAIYCPCYITKECGRRIRLLFRNRELTFRSRRLVFLIQKSLSFSQHGKWLMRVVHILLHILIFLHIDIDYATTIIPKYKSDLSIKKKVSFHCVRQCCP